MCPCLPVESLLLHIDFLRIDCVHDLQNQLLAIIIVTIIIIIPITNHANTHHRNGFCVMPLWDSMKCMKSQNQLLFHTMIKLYRQFQLGIVCADVWYRWFNYLNLTNSDLFQTYTKLDRSNVHQTNAKLTHWPNSKKIAKMWPNLRPTNL